jgi:hypothetical protein
LPAAKESKRNAGVKAPLIFVVLVAIRLSSVHGGRPVSYKAAVLADKPFAYYRLSETANTEIVADEVNNNPGIYVNGPKVGVPGAIATDPPNTAITFARGKQQHIELTNFDNFGSNLSNGFTVEFWLKTENSGDQQTIFGVANSPGFVTDFISDIGFYGKAKRLRIYWRDDHRHLLEANCYPEGGNIDIYDNRWRHIAYVYDPSVAEDEQIHFYVDGAPQTITITKRSGLPVLSSFNQALTVGVGNLRGSKQDYLEGSLDDIAFYLSPLSEAQIKTHYRAAGGEKKRAE